MIAKVSNLREFLNRLLMEGISKDQNRKVDILMKIIRNGLKKRRRTMTQAIHKDQFHQDQFHH